MVSMFLGFISARPTEVVSMVNCARDMMLASRSNWGVCVCGGVRVCVCVGGVRVCVCVWGGEGVCVCGGG